jgi:hypothetical protein
MTNTKWLRRALLGGVALSVMAAGAQADELSALKAQLESLQARVNTLETQPATTTMPEGVSLISFSRGQGTLSDWGNDPGLNNQQPANRGFTINVTPTADMPAPVAEIVVYGYVKGDVIYDFNHDLGDSFAVSAMTAATGKEKDHIRLHARQSRFGIKSKVDTAIGQIRTQIEGDFFSSAVKSVNFRNNTTSSRTDLFRLRHAYGEWDITPNWTFLAGQTWSTADLLPIGINTVDFSGPAGPTVGRTPQVRIKYHDGPLSWAVAIESPTHTSETNVPNFASYFQYDFPGGHQFIVTGDIADVRRISTSDIAWAVQAGANINLADMAYLTTGVIYGRGQPSHFGADNGNIPEFAGAAGTGKAVESLGFSIGLSFNINDTTTFNTAFGYFNNLNSVNDAGGAAKRVMTVHANILWRPVSQMQMGWEVMWGEEKFVGGGKKHDVRAQFGTWFYF